ncbi:hypothetical protein TNCV_3318171 [Trichonephila clavipes]|nr:hypothetical protein TNCV_3318171 [Trichonephila clavipes]
MKENEALSQARMFKKDTLVRDPANFPGGEFQQITEFERGRIIGLWEGEFSYQAIGTHVLRNSSTVLQGWKQWTYEHRTTRKTGSGWRKAAHRSTAAGVLMSTSSIRWRMLHHRLRTRVLLYRITLTANQHILRLKWVHEHRAWQAD